MKFKDSFQEAEEYFNLGCLKADQGCWEEALGAFQKAIALKPNHHEAYNNLGATFQALGLLKESEAAFRQAIALEPRYPDAYSNLAVVLKLQSKGKIPEIIEILTTAIKLNPNYAAAYYNLAIIQKEQGQLIEAEKLTLKAISLKSDYGDAYNNLGIIKRDQGLLAEAEKAFCTAIALNPESADAYHNMSIVLCDLERFDEATIAVKKAIAKKANFAEAYHQLGIILKEQGWFEKAEEAYRQALTINPHYPEAHLSLGIILLLKGNFTEGLPNYEWRWEGGNMAFPYLKGKLWDGKEIKDRTILIVAEQGLGDTLQFIRYTKILKEKGAKIKLICQEALVTLLRSNSEIEEVKPSNLPVEMDYDCYIPLLSLPYLLKTNLENIPKQIPYLKATKNIEIPIPQETKLKVGIVWASGFRNSDPRLLNVYHKKSCPISLFMELKEVEGLTLYSVQVGKDSNDLENYEGQDLINLSPYIKDFTDTAAIIDQLDLLISVDTSVAHLAGAMGKPVWLLLPFVADWRWLLNRDDSPWYPTMRLFRQSKPMDWESVIRVVVANLKYMVNPQDNSAEKYNLTGVTLTQQGRWQEAAVAFNQAISLNPDYAEAYYNLGIILIKNGSFQEAENAYRQVIRVMPEAVEAYYNLGVCLKEQSLLDQAKEVYLHTIKLKPDYAQAYHNLGVMCQEIGATDEAIAYFKEAIKYKPDYAKAYNNLGVSLTEKSLLIEAQKYYRLAIQSKSDYYQAYHNLGVILTEQRLLKPAIDVLQQCVAINPDFAEAHFSLAFALLLSGDFQEGFKEYEWRFLADKIPFPQATKPVWDGCSLAGKTILVFAEQGLGDTLQFIRYIPLLKNLGATVKVVCQKPLVELIKNVDGVSEILAFEDNITAKFDYYIALLSLPRLLNTTLDNIPAQIPYIRSNKFFALPIPQQTKLKVGIVWASGFRSSELKLFNIYQTKSCPVSLFVNLLAIPSVSFYSLQVGKDAQDLDAYLPHPQIVNLTSSIKDFSDTAAIVNQLDLVITVDTSVAHLVGAMGKKVWVLLPHFPDWRWLLGRNDTPWYPTMRLFRQTTPKDWEGVFKEIALSLSGLTQSLVNTPVTRDDYFSIALNLEEAGKLSEAAENYRKAIEQKADNLQAYYNYGNVLTRLGCFAEATDIYRHLLTLKPDYAEVYNNLGVAFTQQGLLAQATKAFESAVSLKPDYHEGYFNLGVVLNDQGLLNGAEKAYRRAINLSPEYFQAHYNLATNLLLAGKFHEGFKQYEWRWKSHQHDKPLFTQPEWDGNNPQGKTLLLVAEQGLGDTLQFIRYAQILSELGATVKLVCQNSLVDLLKNTPGVAEVIGFNREINTYFDYYIFLLSLPRVLNTTLETIPKSIPYVYANKTLSIPIPPETSLKVGIVYSSGYRDSDARLYNIYQNKSCPIEHFFKLLSIPGISLYGLQVGKDAVDLPQHPRLVNLSPFIQDFSDTAAIVSKLDLVISVDTSVAHLAGAMGKNVWVILPHVADWRWFLGRSDTPWYPTMRLFRQPSPGDWQSVFVEIINNIS